MTITVAMIRDHLVPGLLRHAGGVNRLAVYLKHGKEWRLVSRRRWIRRWRAEQLGHSGVRARRLMMQKTTKVVR